MKSNKSNVTQRRGGNPLFFFYCLAISYFLGGCTMATATPEDIANGTDYLQERRTTNITSVAVSGNSTGTVINVSPVNPLVDFGNLARPTPDSPTFTSPCRCAWETWSEGSGLMCAGIRCSDTCDDATRGCVERRACVIAGI
jgi:hypothetical protein